VSQRAVGHLDRFLAWAAAASLIAGAGCSDDAGACVEAELACNPLYQPTFDNVFTQTLNDKCADAPCHDAQAPQANLSYVDPDQAYDLLLGIADGRERVLPGDPGCSLLIRRIESMDPGFQMPPGARLSEQERCSVRQWIADGAER
jgi:hypothetical protein